jgi:ABC-type multidrug transport system fused ATPase/permease subunit
LLENVRYAAPDADEAQVRDALERAQLGEFLRRERDGVSTQIGERGARLSGGERQRLAIARAIVSHREQPLIGADALLELRNGRIREVSP